MSFAQYWLIFKEIRKYKQTARVFFQNSGESDNTN